MKNDPCASETQHVAIEQLMGHGLLTKTINDTHSQGQQRQVSLESLVQDYQVCKSYIVGTCPYELFQGTKEYHGKCPQLHISQYKYLYKRKFHELILGKSLGNEEIDENDRNIYLEFNKHYYRTMAFFIKQCDVSKKAANEKLESKTEDERLKISQVSKTLDDIDENIGLMIAEIEALIKHHELDKATLQSAHLSRMYVKREEVVKQVRDFTSKVAQSDKQELQVCDVCGAYLSRLDNDKRLADHFLGKVHLAYVTMRTDMKFLETLFKKNKITLKSILDTNTVGNQHISRRHISQRPSAGPRGSTQFSRGRGRGRGISYSRRSARYTDQGYQANYNQGTQYKPKLDFRPSFDNNSGYTSQEDSSIYTQPGSVKEDSKGYQPRHRR